VSGGALLVGVFLVASTGTVRAQEPGRILQPPAGATYAFDAASVKPTAPDARMRVFDFQPTGSLVARNQTLRFLIAMAYGTPFPVPLPDERIVGGPEWLTTARFAVDARVERPPDRATAARDIGFMLRTLLADRFAVRVRFEPRPQLAYALERASKPGRRITLRASKNECTKGGCGVSGGPGKLELRGATLDLLALTLSELVGRPVVNQTGLTNAFDGTPEWAPSPEDAAAFGGAAAPDAQAGASLFTAIKEQLGLELRGARVPLEIVVVTHAERPSPD
jgi:uncharacterized protein (TIGR03435 family)